MNESHPNWLEQALRSLLPDDIAVHAEITAADFSAGLFPEERDATTDMVPKRLAEFARGRHCAHRAMQKLGLPPVAIAKGKNREPLWPAQITASISHTDTLAAAAAGWSEHYAGIGVDIEAPEPLDAATGKLVARPDEPAADGRALKQLFGIKEAIYKTIYPTVKRFVDFQEMEVAVDDGRGAFSAIPHIAGLPENSLTGLRGRFTEARGMLICCAWLPRQ